MEGRDETAWLVRARQAVPGAPGTEELLAQVRELRARILFDGGRRPAFRAEDGAHVDDQDLDLGAWHFVARREPDGPPLGYVRLCPAGSGTPFQSRTFLGDRAYAEVLHERGLVPEATFEHSRLVVEHRARKQGLGVHLNALAIAAAGHLGARAMIGTSGTKDGQDAFHERFGFRPVPGTRRYVERYTEDVVLMLLRLDEGAGEHAELVERLRARFPQIVMDSATGIDPPVRRPATGARPLADTADRAGWRPELIDPADRCRLGAVLGSGRVHSVHDTLDAQLEELIRSREPGRAFDARAMLRAKEEQLDGATPAGYGSWAWYPWSGRLVRVLPRAEFRLVRTDRNRGRIERSQQRALLERRIGVVGLSVGNSSAVTLALEGVGGSFALADFDAFGLSNLNRLRGGVHDLGVNKAVLCARQLVEIDPYLDVDVHRAGLTEAGLDDFFLAGGPLDLLVEECDTPYVKLAARERARELGVPVVMDCNDRGMLDVERFDTEPDRPLLHGLLGELKSGDVLAMSPAERVRLLLAMVDESRISAPLAAAFPQLGRTLSSWPQLASGVALGGALTTEAARRILLGQQCPSGRYYIDLDELIAADRDVYGGRT